MTVSRFAVVLAIIVGVTALMAQTPSLVPERRETLTMSAPEMARLTRAVLAAFPADSSLTSPRERWRVQFAMAEFAESAASLATLRDQLIAANQTEEAGQLTPYLVFARAKAREAADRTPLPAAYRHAFHDLVGGLDDWTANRLMFWFRVDVETARAELDAFLRTVTTRGALGPPEWLDLARRYLPFEVARATGPIAAALIVEDEHRRYIIERDVLIKTPDGATLSAVVVKPRSAGGRLPAALEFTIYADLDRAVRDARRAASRGYVGVVADARGKRLSPDPVAPYEHEVADTRAVIDWITRQGWSNGEVGMYGGSYNGYAAWAATKRLHPALKTIVASVAAIPGFGLPMENNVFLNANYAWAFYVTNNRYLDELTYNQPARWGNLNRTWYESGRSYREIDRVDGTPNPWLQRWLQHPAFDKYWQSQVPYGNDFANITIPVLTITGYYDDGQLSAMRYLREHYRHRKNAQHYVVIGPYDHFGAQAAIKPAVLRNYPVDPVAQFDTNELTFQWLDHVMRRGPRPALVKDVINYQVMGTNTWKHAPSLDAMSNRRWRLYLSPERQGEYLRLSDAPTRAGTFVRQTVDLADRTTSNNTSYYPAPIVRRQALLPSGLAFVTEPIAEPLEISGSFGGRLNVSINKRDFDYGMTLYELTADGRSIHLSYHIARASFAEDETRRVLLTPGQATRIPIGAVRITSRRLEPGSRLLVIFDVNKNAFSQVNYGTGKDVSDEAIADAGEPLDVRLFGDSYIDLPVAAADHTGGRPATQ